MTVNLTQGIYHIVIVDLTQDPILAQGRLRVSASCSQCCSSIQYLYLLCLDSSIPYLYLLCLDGCIQYLYLLCLDSSKPYLYLLCLNVATLCIYSDPNHSQDPSLGQDPMALSQLQRSAEELEDMALPSPSGRKPSGDYRLCY
jgi:hypothetical protein